MTGNNKIAAPRMRLTSLDAVRGIASFSVVLCHCWAAIPDAARTSLSSSMWSPLLGLFTNGDAAVIIFFVLSGYVIALPFFRGTQPSYPRYLLKRFCRIYIPFAVVISIAALLARFTDIGEPLAGVGDWLNEQMSSADAPAVLAGHFLMIGTKQDIAQFSHVDACSRNADFLDLSAPYNFVPRHAPRSGYGSIHARGFNENTGWLGRIRPLDSR
jgi:hypothetical protein